jgi:hypothetical protein
VAASRSDQAFLAGDATFQNRVRQSVVAACIAISSEGWAVLFHKTRARQCQNVLINPDFFKLQYSIAVATDPSVISDATQNGTVALTVNNALAQGGLVTDAHIDAAVSGQFNSFFDTLS